MSEKKSEGDSAGVIVVNKDLCIACGNCWGSAPEYFLEDKDGKSKVIKSNIDKKDMSLIQDAIDNCSTAAISIEQAGVSE